MNKSMTHAQYEAWYTARRKKMLQMRKTMSIQKIADVYKISRQRVAQILGSRK